MLDFTKSVGYITCMRTYRYYQIRSVVRFAFWSSLGLSVGLLAKISIESWDNYDCHPKQVVVEQYDTLWAIAERNCKGSIQRAVDDLVDERGTTIVRIGETVELTSKS